MARHNLCSECPVRSRALCCALTAEQLDAFNRISYRKHYPAGRLISDVDQEERFANERDGSGMSETGSQCSSPGDSDFHRHAPAPAIVHRQ